MKAEEKKLIYSRKPALHAIAFFKYISIRILHDPKYIFDNFLHFNKSINYIK